MHTEYRKRWRSNIPKLLRAFGYIQNRRDQDSRLYKLLKEYKPEDDPDFELGNNDGI